MKKIHQQLLLTVALLLCSIGIANAEILSGSCGENATWKLDTETGVLDITGTGEIRNGGWSSSSLLIKTVNIGNGITSIGDITFCGAEGMSSTKYTNLTSVIIPNSVTSIGRWAFGGCSGLKTITLPNSLTTIGECALCQCTGLTELYIPASVTQIDPWNTSGSTGLTKITVDPNNMVYDSRNNCNAIIKTSTNELVAGCKTTVIPDGITSLGVGCFDLLPVPDGFKIPNSVTTIDRRAFYLSKARSVVIGDGVTGIGNEAFYGCSELKSITIGKSVTDIGYYAFEGCM